MTIDISKLNSLYINSKKVSSLWLNGKKLKLGEEATSDALTFTALEAPFTVYLQKTGSPYTVSLVYSTDGSTWNDYNVGDSITVSRVNAKVMFKAKTTNATFSSSTSSYYSFYSSQRCNVSGNIMSLLDITSDSVYDYAFYKLFTNNIRIVDASELLLPATSLGKYCYMQMFYQCSQLTATPLVFPASLVNQDSYKEMFYGCTSLVDASNVQLCCNAISAGGMWGMFQSCRNLTAAPFMPEVTAANWDARTYMFAYDRHLAQLSTRQTSWATEDRGGNYWMRNVSSNGIFYCPEALGTDETMKRGDSAGGCPSNWLVANYNVDGTQLSNAFTRGSYTTAFFEDGSSHTPDFSSLSVYNRQTAQKLVEGTDYTITYPADTTTVGTKTCTFTGISPYTGTKDFTYLIASKSLAACTFDIGSAYDDEGPIYVNVVQPQVGYTLVEDTDYTLSWSTSGDETTVTITGINGWSGTYTRTVAHKTSGTSPITVYKHDSSDTKPLKVTLRSRYFSENASLQCKADSNAWTAMNVDTQLTASTQIQIRAVGSNRRLATSDNYYLWIDTGYNDSTAAAAAVSGNIMSLVDRSETQDIISANYTFANTFANNDNLIDASHLSCSQVSSNVTRAFRAVCASRGMGFGILEGNPSQLTGAPDLFANVSAYGNRQYQMGDTCRNCSRLTSAVMTIPALAQSTSNEYSIGNACFQACTGLTSAVVKSHNGDGYVPSYIKCLQDTFLSCSSLTRISTDISSWPTNGFQDWVKGVAATGTFICPEALGTNETIQRGVNFCPIGWTVVNYDANLKFTAEEANSTLALSAVGNAPAVSLLKSTDGETWSSYTVGDTITLANEGDYVCFKADQPNNGFASSNVDYNHFVMTGKIAASGDIMRLLGKDTLASYSFARLFAGCTSLTQAPELLATALAENCYENMFKDCTSLTQAPALPATTFAENCYRYMFSGCTSLTELKMPKLKTLSTTPTMAYMLQNCTSLTSITTQLSSWSSSATTNWLDGASTTGTFTLADPTCVPSRDASGVPVGWTVEQPTVGEFWKLTVKECYRKDAQGNPATSFDSYYTQFGGMYLYDENGNVVNSNLTEVDTNYTPSLLQNGQCCKGSEMTYGMSNESMEKMFDGSNTSKCATSSPFPTDSSLNDSTKWLVYCFRLPANANTPVSYNFYSGDDGNPERNAISWVLETSTDGTNWIVVDEKTQYTTGLPSGSAGYYNNGTAFTLA